tara:strand:- start:578 stop:1318 length:741 start_codon:yes stop_codon:yes gene_type:complete
LKLAYLPLVFLYFFLALPQARAERFIKQQDLFLKSAKVLQCPSEIYDNTLLDIYELHEQYDFELEALGHRSDDTVFDAAIQIIESKVRDLDFDSYITMVGAILAMKLGAVKTVQTDEVSLHGLPAETIIQPLNCQQATFAHFVFSAEIDGGETISHVIIDELIFNQMDFHNQVAAIIHIGAFWLILKDPRSRVVDPVSIRRLNALILSKEIRSYDRRMFRLFLNSIGVHDRTLDDFFNWERYRMHP